MRLVQTIVPLTCAALLAACAAPYKTFYNETNHQLRPAPVSPEQVRVVKTRADLSSPFTELGVYRGKAPTVVEAMDAAKRECGQHGADLYILNVEPFPSEGGWKIDGVCAVMG